VVSSGDLKSVKYESMTAVDVEFISMPWRLPAEGSPWM